MIKSRGRNLKEWRITLSVEAGGMKS